MFEVRNDGPLSYKFLRHVDKQLDHIIEDPVHAGAKLSPEASAAWKAFGENLKKWDKELAEGLKQIAEKKLSDVETKDASDKLTQQTAAMIEPGAKKLAADHKDLTAIVECWQLKQNIFQMHPKRVNEVIVGTKYLDKKKCDMPVKSADEPPLPGILQGQPDLHLAYRFPLATLGVLLLRDDRLPSSTSSAGCRLRHLSARVRLLGNFGPQNELGIELIGLYWHFVDIVWIFLFLLCTWYNHRR